MHKHKILTPVTWPVLSFALVILVGALLLWTPPTHQPGEDVGFVDALFISTSAVCVTGLATIDIGTVFNRGGLWVILLLIQLGGLGITTYTSLVFVLWRNRVPFTDRLAVSQALLNKDIFDLRSFVRQVVGLVLAVEGMAALLLYWHDPVHFTPFNAVFHAVSAFCNAGFSMFPDNLISFRDDLAVNAIIAGSIVAGGLGFAVLRELVSVGARRVELLWEACCGRRSPAAPMPYPRGGGDEDEAAPGLYALYGAPGQNGLHGQNGLRAPGLDRYSRLVIKTSAALIVLGALAICLLELPDLPPDSLLDMEPGKSRALTENGFGTGFSLVLSALFQSVSARTAGFSSIDLTTYSHASLLVLVALMFIGGSPGSCAGGIKTTTFRVLAGFMGAQLRGRRQIVLEDRAVTQEAVARALTLFFFAVLTVGFSVTLLSVTETNFHGITPAGEQPPLMSLLFEVVSALGTVGLSLNVTPKLSEPGKVIIILNMFVGRVGFIAMITALSSLRSARHYEYPSMDLPVG